jgi:hypothetical protein
LSLRQWQEQKGGSKSRLFRQVYMVFYWQGYILPSSSFVMVPGWQRKPLRVA